jgi:hypothetical protein
MGIISVAFNVGQRCYRHLTADTNRLWKCDRNLSLVINFDALIGK